MPPLSESQLETFIRRVDRDVLRLGTRERLVCARLVREAGARGWSVETTGDSLSSALATDRDTWREIRRIFEQCVPRAGQPIGSAVPRRLLLALAGLVVLGLSATLLYHTIPASRPDAGVVTYQHADMLEVGTPDLGAPDLAPPSRCTTQPLDAAPPAPRVEHKSVRPPLAKFSTGEWALLITLSFVLLFAALLLLRLRGYLRARLEELVQRIDRERAEKQDREARQRSAAQAQRAELEQEAIEQGLPVRPQYRVELEPPVPTEVVEDCATLLGRAFSSHRGQELDIDATLSATTQAGGQVRPIFLPTRSPRPLLVLYDDTETRPYLPGFLALVNRWQRLGVDVTVLRFERHPSVLKQPGSRARPLELLDLARQHEGASVLLYASRLMVMSRERELEWPRALRQFAVRVWLDPDPRLPEERDSEEQAELEILSTQLARYPLTSDGLLALSKQISAPQEAVRVPDWSPPPPLLAEGVTRWTEVWLALGSLVPDAAMDQLEAVRQKLLLDHLPDPRSIARLMERLKAVLGPSFKQSHQTVLLSDELRMQLLGWLKKEEPALLDRVAELLEQSVVIPQEEATGKHSLLYYDAQLRLLTYRALRVKVNPAGVLDVLDGSPLHEEVQARKRILQVLTEQEGVTIVKETIEVRPDKLTWSQVRPLRLVSQSALLAAVGVVLLSSVVGGAVPRSEWLQAALRAYPPVDVEVTKEPPIRLVDERVNCPERPNPTSRPLVVAEAEKTQPAPSKKSATPRPPRAQPLLPATVPATVSSGPPDVGPEVKLVQNPDLSQPSPTQAQVKRPKMLPIPAGSFDMGGPGRDEQPVHRVELSAFEMSETEVTQEQYEAVMGWNPSSFKGKVDSAIRPVERVSWLDAVRYCNKLTELVIGPAAKCYEVIGETVSWRNPSCRGYRLPTEAEWEYAARAGEDSEFSGSANISEVGWYRNNSKGETHPVEEKNANQWKLRDMTGNVWEWVWDWYDDTYYTYHKKFPTPSPRGPESSKSRVRRGGSWNDDAGYARVAYRFYGLPGDRYSFVGFRLARSND